MTTPNSALQSDLLDAIMKQYLDLSERADTTSEQWMEFAVSVARKAHELVQQAIDTKDKSINRNALQLCTIGLLAAQHIGMLHPVIPRLAYESALLHFQVRQFFKAGQLFFLAHRSFDHLGNEELSIKSLEHCKKSFLMSFKEAFTVATRLTVDYYNEIAWNYLVLSVRSLIALRRADINHEDIIPHLHAVTEFLNNEGDRFEKNNLLALEQVVEELKDSQELNEQTMANLEKALVKLLPSAPRMLLIIYEDGRLVYGYDFRNKSENSTFFAMMAGVLFAIISLLSLELKVGTLSQLQTEEGIALVQKHEKVYFFLLCSGEPGPLRANFQSFMEEFIRRYSGFLQNWHGAMQLSDARTLIDLFF